MNAADQGSFSSATPDTSADTDAGDEVVDVVGDTTEGTPGTNEQQESNVVGSTGGVVAVSPKPVYNTNGKLLEVDAATTAAVDNFSAPAGFARKGDRFDSFMYAVGVYVEESEGTNHKYFCLANANCRRSKKVVPRPKKDRSNVNTHLKKVHKMQGKEGAQKATNKQATQTTIDSALKASANSGLGKTR